MALPQTVVKELEEAFFLFDFDKDKKVTSKEIGAVIRSVGLNPTEVELKAMIKDVDGAGGTIDVNGLLKLIGKHMPNPITTADELREAFQVFDKQGNGMISLQDLRHSLTALGERLADEELDELVRSVDAEGEGHVSYEDVIKVLLAK